ncbi:MAG: endospore germination permease [Lysinibacillus sp.]
MKNAGAISILHVILLSMTVIGLKNHVTIIPPLLEEVGRDGWIAVLFSTVAIFPWLFLLVYIHNQSKQQPIKEWLKQKIGQVGASIVLYSTAVYLIILAAVTMVEALQWVVTTFLPRTPILLLLIVFTILCIYLVTTNLQTIVMVNFFVLSVVVVLGFFVAFTNIQVKDYELLQPFFEHGLSPVLKGMVFPASGFVEVLMLLFIQHQIKDRMKWYHFTVIILILMGLTIGPLIGAITEFGPNEAAKQLYPAYEEWGLVQIGRFIEHLDFFSIYQWLTGAFIRIGFILFVVSDILNISGDKKRIWEFIAPPFFFMCLGLFLMNEPLFLDFKGKYLLTATVIFFFILSVILGIAAIISKKSSNNIQTKSGEK